MAPEGRPSEDSVFHETMIWDLRCTLSAAAQPLPLSPREQEILSLCLRSAEDPRDIGMLIAILAVERKESAGKEPAP